MYCRRAFRLDRRLISAGHCYLLVGADKRQQVRSIQAYAHLKLR